MAGLCNWSGPRYPQKSATSFGIVLAHLVSELAEHLDRVEPYRLGEGQEFDHMERSLPGFHPDDPGLRSAQALGNIFLLEAFGLPLCPEPLGQNFVSSGCDCLHLTIMKVGVTIFEI